MLEKFFKLKENGTSVRTEIIGGITTFVAMAYIIFLNPSVLSQTGMPVQGVFLATIFTAIFGTLIMGLFANIPYAIAPSIGMQAFFTYTIVFGFGFTWKQALGMVFLVGLVDVIITLSKVRSLIVKSIPEQLKHAIGGGIGLFIAYIGIKNAGFLNFIVDPDNITTLNDKPFKMGAAVNEPKGIASILANSGTTPELATFNNPQVLLALIGFIILIVLVLLKVPGGFLISVIATTIIGIPMGVTNTHIEAGAAFSATFHDFGKVFLAGVGKDGLWSMFDTPQHIFFVIMTVFAMGLTGLFDAVGTFIGTGEQTGIFTEEDMKEFYNGKGFKSKMDKGLVADTFATMAAGLFGTSNTTTFIETATGIKAGARTGLSNVIIAIGFAISIIFAPFVGVIPSQATAPILIIVGIMMMNELREIEWHDIEVAIPAFFTSVFMAFSYSISYGIAAGFILYLVVKIVTRKFKDINPVIVIVSIFFIINFVIQAIM
jgi:AGZA family xanthine/uracil permease-like MFS transporter